MPKAIFPWHPRTMDRFLCSYRTEGTSSTQGLAHSRFSSSGFGSAGQQKQLRAVSTKLCLSAGPADHWVPQPPLPYTGLTLPCRVCACFLLALLLTNTPALCHHAHKTDILSPKMQLWIYNYLWFPKHHLFSNFFAIINFPPLCWLISCLKYYPFKSPWCPMKRN